MHIVIVPDSYKESLSATHVASLIKQAFLNYFPDARYSLLPLADGGEGTVDAILFAKQGKRCHTEVLDPLGRLITASWGLIDDGKTAVIEMSAASGLPLLALQERNPRITSTYGTGQLIQAALNQGVQKIIIGLGGSATNDAGAGIIQALGGKLLDKQGKALPLGGGALSQFDQLDLSSVDPRLQSVELIVACDVSNPLCGMEGASQIFGEQKGADFAMRSELDDSLMHFAMQIEQQRLAGSNRHTDPSMGAAGGTPFGLAILHPSLQIVSGIEFMLTSLEYDAVIKQADLVITGEGKMDNQTLNGKTPLGVAKLAKQMGIPVIGICGVVGDDKEQLNQYFDAIFPTIQSLKTLEQTLLTADRALYDTAYNVASLLTLRLP